MKTRKYSWIFEIRSLTLFLTVQFVFLQTPQPTVGRLFVDAGAEPSPSCMKSTESTTLIPQSGLFSESFTPSLNSGAIFPAAIRNRRDLRAQAGGGFISTDEQDSFKHRVKLIGGELTVCEHCPCLPSLLRICFVTDLKVIMPFWQTSRFHVFLIN